MSADVLSEIRDVLTRLEHRAKFPALTPRLVDAFLARCLCTIHWVENVPHTFDVPRDPKDNPYVDLAVAAGAKYLVTWNHRHLGYLMDNDTPEGRDFCRRFPLLRVVDPPTFLKEIGEAAGGSETRKS